jgi:hypothetical protein
MATVNRNCLARLDSGWLRPTRRRTLPVPGRSLPAANVSVNSLSRAPLQLDAAGHSILQCRELRH